MPLEEIDIKDEYYRNILDYIRQYFPSFKTIFDKEDVYPIMFEFGNYLCDNYLNPDVIGKAASFINEAICKGTFFTEDLIVLQVFHLLYEDRTRYMEFENFLSDRAKEVYENSYRLWLKL